MQGDQIAVRNLHYAFPIEDVLRDVTFSIPRGQFVSIVGPSGCGKTLLLRILAGLVPSESGTIHWGSLGARPAIGMAFQRDGLFPWLTLEENLTVCMGRHPGSKAARSKEALRLLDIAGLARFRYHRPDQVSGGMAQKVNVLRAFACDPPLVLMDEPFAHLDAIQRQELHEFTLGVWERTRPTIVFVSHDIDETLLLSDRVFVLTSKPSSVATTLEIAFPRPRTPGAIRKDERYASYFEEILSHLRNRNEGGFPVD